MRARSACWTLTGHLFAVAAVELVKPRTTSDLHDRSMTIPVRGEHWHLMSAALLKVELSCLLCTQELVAN